MKNSRHLNYTKSICQKNMKMTSEGGTIGREMKACICPMLSCCVHENKTNREIA